MAFFGFLRQKPKIDRLLAESIEHNADLIARSEGKDRKEATYLAICTLLDDLKTRANGQAGHQAVIAMMQPGGPYDAHLNDVMTYLAWSTGALEFKPEFDLELAERHQVGGGPDLAAISEFVATAPDDALVEATRRQVLSLDPNGCAMLLVAYNNMKHVMLPATTQLRMKQLRAGTMTSEFPGTIEAYARFLTRSPLPDAVARRRTAWFLYGLMVLKTEKLSAGGQYEATMAEVWGHLRHGRALMPGVLEQNRLWSGDEKMVGMTGHPSLSP